MTAPKAEVVIYLLILNVCFCLRQCLEYCFEILFVYFLLGPCRDL